MKGKLFYFRYYLNQLKINNLCLLFYHYNSTDNKQFIQRWNMSLFIISK